MRHGVVLDIHDYDVKYAQTVAYVDRSGLSPRNKELIGLYRDACLVRQVTGKVRLIRVMSVLVLFGTRLHKDFDHVTRDDLQSLVAGLVNNQPAYSPETIASYKAILKRFMTYVLRPDEFPRLSDVPAMISWITTHVRSKDKRRLQRKDLLTPQDMTRLLAACQTNRDRALVSTLWETGCRVAEIGNLQVQHVTPTDHGFTLDLTGKTGQRSPLVVGSAPYLAQWLGVHPYRSSPEAPLWVHAYHTGTPRQIKYATIRKLLQTLFRRAGVTKPFHPHIFRHSRATYVLASGLMNEPQAKAYFGWTPGSDMLSTYAHLIDTDANNAILTENNLSPATKREEALTIIACTICGETNPPGTDYCTRCTAVLNQRKAYEHQQLHDLKDEVVMHLFRVMVEKGLVDDAARAVHDAGLGGTLRRIAQHLTGEAHLLTNKQPTDHTSARGPFVTTR